MSAAQWRRAMNGGLRQAGSRASGLSGLSGHGNAPYASSTPQAPATGAGAVGARSAGSPGSVGIGATIGVAPRHLVTLFLLGVLPFVATPFITYQVVAQALVLGLIALSLTFLAGYGGMVSLAQMSIAGMAGYGVAVFGASSTPISLDWPWWLAILMALLVATLFATLIGWLSVRTEGIYTIMITLSFGVAFYYLVLQNYTVFNGFQGFQKVYPPELFGIDWRSPLPFYFLSLFWALAGYLAVKWLIRTPFGIALQGVRDNPRRMSALGFNVTAHRVAAYTVAGVMASVGGVLLVWYNGLITPGSVHVGWQINILVIAVLGGMRHPIGAFLGAIVFTVLQTFAVDIIDRERFNLVIGLVFLGIVLFSSDGLLGLWAWARSRLQGRKRIF